MSRVEWIWGRPARPARPARLAAPALTLGFLVWRLGTRPFLDGVRMIDGTALAAATAVAVLTTVCCAWRWKLVAGGLGIDLALPAAVAAYYRSVAWERSAGQVVQVVLTMVVLLALPSPVHSSMPLVAIAVLAAACLGVLVARARPGGGRSAWARVRSALARDIHDALLARKAWLGIAIASALVVVGHAITFLIAARTAGTAAPPSQMLPIALLVMMAMVLPSAGGWGPREGVTAWAFAAAGLGAQRGVTTAVVYGVMVLVAALPGAGVLVVAWFRRTWLPEGQQRQLREGAAHA